MGNAIRVARLASRSPSNQPLTCDPNQLERCVEGLKAYRLQRSALQGEKLVSAFRLAVRMIKARRQRDLIFGARLFGEPVWDMLLDLFVENLRQKPVPVSSLCVASAVPASTALRWIDTVEEAGLCQRFPDPDDKRRAFVVLTADALDALVNVLCDPASQS